MARPSPRDEDDERAFRIYLCGSYRDREGNGRQAKEFLLKIEARLRGLGFDAYTQLHPRAEELAPGLTPAEKTRALERLSDLNVYIGIPEGREGGWSSELSDIQVRYPAGAEKRVVLLRVDFPLSQVLSNEHGGHLSEPLVRVYNWEDEDELVRLISNLAAVIVEYGRLPEATRRAGRLRISDLAELGARARRE